MARNRRWTLVSLACLACAVAGSGCADDTKGGDEVGDTAGTEAGDGDGDTGDGDTGDGDGDGDTGDGDGDGDGDPGPEPASVPGCGDSSFYEVPADPAERGPWAVGAKTVVVDGVTTEIWYPAQWGSELGEPAKTYDLREALPESEQGKISDAQNPLNVCDCHDGLPIDAAHGPYPVVVFIHGTASFRHQSLTQTTHWASRGFVVVSSDHEGLWLRDTLGLVCGQGGGNQDLSGDTDAVLAALAAPSGELEFLAGLLDLDRVAVTGHSAGGSAAASQTDKPGVRVSIPMASGEPVTSTAALESSLLLGGLADGVVAYSATQSGYEGSPMPKRLVGIDNAGHLAFSDICELENDQGLNILEIAVESGVCGAELAGFLFDCDPNFIDPLLSRRIINHSSTAVLEEVLKCVEGPDLFADFQANFPDVGEYQESL